MATKSVGELTEVENCRQFARKHGDKFRFDRTAKRWYRWDGKRWAVDALGCHVEAAKEVTDSLWTIVANSHNDFQKAAIRHATRSQTRQGIAGLLTLAQSEPKIAVGHEAWDADPYLLNCASGTVNLKTGKIGRHDRSQLQTKLAPVAYDPQVPTPKWDNFLSEILGSAELIAFVQRVFGLSLIGKIDQELLLIFHGSGANGKSTLLNVFARILGDYGKPADPELLLSHRDSQHPTGVADLMGARFVYISEVKGGRKFDEGTLKRLCSKEKRNARFMRQDFFQYIPSDTIFLSVNDKPLLVDFSPGMARRLKLIPFSFQIPEERWISDLDEVLVQEEGPGILAWAVRGCLDYLAAGLQTPEIVTKATDSYRAEQDRVAAFFSEECVLDPKAITPSANLYETWVGWCSRNGEEPGTSNAFSRELGKRTTLTNTPQYGPARRAAWSGIGLRSKQEPTMPSPLVLEAMNVFQGAPLDLDGARS